MASENSSAGGHEKISAGDSSKPEDDFQTLIQKYKDIVSTLPVDHTYDPVTIRFFQGFWHPESSFPGRLIARDLFSPRPSDLLLVSNDPCSGSWIKALAFSILHRKDYPSAAAADHPLISTCPQDLVRYVEWYYLTGRRNELDELPPPRILASNSPYSVLPALFSSSGLRIVYVCREPKDAFFSAWDFCSSKLPAGFDRRPLATAMDLYLEGLIASGPPWNHYLEYWHESVKRPETVLFLRYEELMKDLAGNIKKLAAFLGSPFSEEEEEKGVVQEMAKLCDFDNLSNLDVNKKTDQRSHEFDQKDGETPPPPPPPPTAGEVKMRVTNDMYFKHSKVGVWKDHLTPAMAQRFDDVTKEKLQGSGLIFD